MHVPLDERTERWLTQANADFDAVSLLAERHPHLACFHAQQASDKAVKAVLTRLTGDALPSHELDRLLGACERSGLSVPDAVLRKARSLDKYYVPTRYPDALGFADAALTYGLEDVAAAQAAAADVRDWCDEAIGAMRADDDSPP